MVKLILIGPVSCGKSTLCQALNDKERVYKKTQVIEIAANVIDTPGEYLELRYFNRVLSVAAAGADVVLLLQDCTDSRPLYSPAFSTMFGQKPVFGVISKIDKAKSNEQITRAENILRNAGASKIFRVSGMSGAGIEELRAACGEINIPGFNFFT